MTHQFVDPVLGEAVGQNANVGETSSAVGVEDELVDPLLQGLGVFLAVCGGQDVCES